MSISDYLQEHLPVLRKTKIDVKMKQIFPESKEK